MLSIKSLSVGYGYRTVIRDIICDIPDGCCVLLAGANGSGKSTLLNTIAGVLKPVSGEVVSDAQVILVPTGIPKVKGFTVCDFAGTAFYTESRWFVRRNHSEGVYVRKALEMLGVSSYSDRDISTLSDGEFQKACVATAVARILAGSGRGVLLLDEPSAFLDVDGRAALAVMLRSLAHDYGVTVIYSSHDIYGQFDMADRIMAVTRDGRIILSDEESSSKQAALSSAFASFTH